MPCCQESVPFFNYANQLWNKQEQRTNYCAWENSKLFNFVVYTLCICVLTKLLVIWQKQAKENVSSFLILLNYNLNYVRLFDPTTIKLISVVQKRVVSINVLRLPRRFRSSRLHLTKKQTCLNYLHPVTKQLVRLGVSKTLKLPLKACQNRKKWPWFISAGLAVIPIVQWTSSQLFSRYLLRGLFLLEP